MNRMVVVLLLIAVVWLGSLVAWRLARHYERFLPLMLGFGGGYILAVTVLHLLPEAYAHDGTLVGWMVLLGLMLQLALEHFSGGIEHGHLHDHGHYPGLAVVAGLSLHSLLEGLPLGSAAGMSWPYVAAILLHKLPAAIALTALCMAHRRRFPLWPVLIFSLASPLGLLIGEQVAVFHEAGHVLLAVVAGSFLHIATTIVFEADAPGSHKMNTWRLAALLAGIGGAALTL